MPEELKDLAIFCLEMRGEWENNYSKLTQYLNKMLENSKYGTEDKLDWEGLPDINTSLASLEIVTMNPIGEPPMFNGLLSYIMRFINAIISGRDMFGFNS